MIIRNLITSFILAALGATGAAQLFAQSTSLSDITEGSLSDRSEDNQRGRIESSQEDQEVIGPSVDAVREAFQELQGTQRQRKNQNMSIENFNERRDRGRRRGRQTPPPPVHVQLQPRFDFYRPASAQVATGIQVNLNRLLEYRNAGSVSVTVDQRVAVMSGNVQSEYERALLEKLVKIEPGISWVENRIVIGANQTNSAP